MRSRAAGLRAAGLRALSGPLGSQLALALPLLLSISVFYAYMSSSGTFEDQPQQSYYDEMARGFQSGHLYIERLPRPELLAQPDPFHSSHRRLWLWDATLYEGHYYLYWGPVPALLIWASKWLTHSTGTISDSTLTLAFLLGRLYAGAALLLGLGRYVRTRQPPWLVSTIIAVFGLTSPIPFIVARPHIYEACLAAGQCFLFAGLAVALWGLLRPSRRVLKFLAAGTLWGLAIGSRVTMCLAIPGIIAATIAIPWLRSGRSWRRLFSDGIALSAPVALSLGAYAIYNYARFGSVTEFGLKWQLSTQTFETDAAFVIPNLFSYLFAPPKWDCRFPFVSAVAHRPLSSWIEWPAGYESFELVVGLLILSGWCWLAVLVLGKPLASLWSRRRSGSLPSDVALPTPELWLGWCSVANLLAMLPVIGLWEASMRYPGDAIGGVVLLGALAAVGLLRWVDGTRRRWAQIGTRVLVGLLALHSCVLGALSSVDSYELEFATRNPAVYESLQQSLSFCPGDA